MKILRREICNIKLKNEKNIKGLFFPMTDKNKISTVELSVFDGCFITEYLDNVLITKEALKANEIDYVDLSGRYVLPKLFLNNIIHFITADVYKSILGDFSNNGISCFTTEVLVICESGNIEYDVLDETCPEYIVGIFNKNGTLRAYPLFSKDNSPWFMMGGSFIYSSDMRFRFDYPVPLHDRTE